MADRALVFVGFMGAGKSTSAREAAQALGVEAVDSDRVIEADLGEKIEEFFDREGEAAFRAKEEETILRLLAGGPDVVALGGGALGSARVRQALEDHVVVHVGVDVRVAWDRAAHRGRPLARDKDRFEALYAERSAVYEAAADAFLPPADRHLARRAAPALDALGRGPRGTRMAWARAASGEYPVYVGRGLLGDGGLPWPVAGRRFAVSDESVAALHVGKLSDLSGLVEIPPGEEAKTIATAERVWRALAQSGVTRADHVVALGGGVVGDLAGFCAATYQRGIRVVQVPTTVVAMVDSAYGGKTGVDLPEGKNYVGAYHQPSAVLADTTTLATLPPEEHAAGYAEVVKTALIAGGALWERVASGAPVDDATVFACARTKLRVVAEDERDGGRRQVLNLGHTIGHAIETVTGYGRYRHGEAVALGLLAALRLSGTDGLREEVAGLLATAGLPTRLDPAIDPAAVVAATAADKKRVGEEVPYVLVDAPGAVAHGRSVPPAAVLAAVQELRG